MTSTSSYLVRLAVCLLPLLLSFVVSTPIILSPDGQRALQTKERKLHGRFLHISDFHPDEFYRPYTSTDDDISCHRGAGDAGFYGAEATDCDSPLSLVDATFKWLGENLKDRIDFVVWTGDSARHDSDEEVPRRADEVLRTNRHIADKFVDTFSDGSGQLAIPVIPSLGNNDFLPHNIFRPGPNRWLDAYLDIWRHFIPEPQRHSFQFGGWFYVEVIPNRLAVFSLNTMYFFDRNAGVDGCAAASEPGYRHLEWLRVQLQLLRDRGMKAILTGHVPPARTDSKQLWDETCWHKYTLWLRRYRDVVAASLYGHMNIDHFMVADSRDIDVELRERASSSGRDDDDDDDYGDGTEFSIESKGNYLQDLRTEWSKLPRTLASQVQRGPGGEVNAEGHRKWGIRYQLAIVNPSIVPNYFPSLRVYEYNITGLRDEPVWKHEPDNGHAAEDEDDEVEPGEGQDEPETLLREETGSPAENPEGRRHELRRDLESLGKKEEEKTRKTRKPKRPHDPSLIIPDPPSKSSAPGPAYSSQPLTLTGYTQYFANLTRLNNVTARDVTADESRPLPFAFEVEYSTMADRLYKLSDLTVRSYVKLAYRIAKRAPRGNHASPEPEEEEEDDDFEEIFDDDDDDDDDDLEADGKNGRKPKKKHGKRSNKVWIRFLSRAFVSSVPTKQLRKWDD